MEEADAQWVIDAVQHGALNDVRAMVARDRALVLRAAGVFGETSTLGVACMWGQSDVVAFLLGEFGVEWNRFENPTRTSLHIADSGRLRVRSGR